MRHLADAWIALAQRVGARGDVAGTGANLLGRWAEAHRAYHDLAHLDEVLRHVDGLADECPHPDTVRLAVWFHDAVYDPQAADNERRSADLATVALAGMDVEPSVVSEVARLVLLTATHDPSRDDLDGAVLCDADLAILAVGETRYASYVEGVRREYAHLDDTAFDAGRAEVLGRLLDRAQLYSTALARRDWEGRARGNIGTERRRRLTGSID